MSEKIEDKRLKILRIAVDSLRRQMEGTKAKYAKAKIVGGNDFQAIE